MFLFNRLLESRLADGYLEEQCKVEQLTPCKYLQNLPRLTSSGGRTRCSRRWEVGLAHEGRPVESYPERSAVTRFDSWWSV